MNFRIAHEFKKITLEQYEKLNFDEPFNIALCRNVRLARELIEKTETDGRLRRVVKVGAEREVPSPVAKIIGAKRIEYTEQVDYTFGTYRGTWDSVSSVLTDKVACSGTFSFADTGDGVQRVVEGNIKVKIFGVGGVVEKFVVADLNRSYQRAAEFTQQWIDAGKLQ